MVQNKESISEDRLNKLHILLLDFLKKSECYFINPSELNKKLKNESDDKLLQYEKIVLSHQIHENEELRNSLAECEKNLNKIESDWNNMNDLIKNYREK